MPPRRTAERRPRSDEVGEQGRAVRELHGQAAVLLRRDRARAGSRVDLHAETADQALEHRAAAVVDLERHQPRRELDDVRREAEEAQGVRRLETEQATTDDEPVGLAALGCCALDGGLGAGPDAVEVVERAIDVAPVGVCPGTGGTNG